MATKLRRREPSPSQSDNSHHPRLPTTPYLTGKILTLASSGERMDAISEPLKHGSPPPPISPSDRLAQAMKNDLDELVGYIDNLAFEQKEETETATTVTNKQLFPGEGNPTSTIYNEHGKNQNNVFQDRTNRLTRNVRGSNFFRKLEDPKIGTVTCRLDVTAKAPTQNRTHSINSTHGREVLMNQEPRMLEPAGNPPRREEPAGSPPSQEASFYFHDESMSLNLSQSQDLDENVSSDSHLNSQHIKVEQDKDVSESLTLPISSLQRNGVNLSPERSKKISFLSISKDPTPSKEILSSKSIINRNHLSTPIGQIKNSFDSLIEDDRDLDSNNDFRRENVVNRRATPFPTNHDRTLDRIEQEDIDRKGNEWWRVRSETPENSIENGTQLNFDSTDSFSVKENNDGRSLKWEENVKSTHRGTQYVSKSTPYPSNKTQGIRPVKIGNNILETPEPQQDKISSLVLASPESAKKLLRSAIEALQDARKERDEARQWADEIKKSVNIWVEDQRRLIRNESISISDNNSVPAAFLEQRNHAIEDVINGLRSEIKIYKSYTDNQLQTMMVKQDEKIQELSRKLTSVKKEISSLMKIRVWKNEVDNDNPDRNAIKVEKTSRFTNVDVSQGFAHKTPSNETTGLARCASRSETSHAASRCSHRSRRSTPNGGHLIDYGNGVTKEFHPDGTSVTRFQNGDVETRFGQNDSKSSSPSASCMVAYYHKKEEVLQITQRDGSILYEYANGQVERHCADGVKIVLFPDGTKTVV